MRQQTTDQITVLVAEDSLEVGERLCDLLAQTENIEIVGRALTGAETLCLQGYYSPDVVLLDLHLPGITGFDLIESVRRRSRDCMIIVLTSDDEASVRARSLKAGADFFMSKHTDFEHVPQMVYALGRARF